MVSTDKLRKIENDLSLKVIEANYAYREELENILKSLGMYDVNVKRNYDGKIGRLTIESNSWSGNITWDIEFHPITKSGGISLKQSGNVNICNLDNGFTIVD